MDNDNSSKPTDTSNTFVKAIKEKIGRRAFLGALGGGAVVAGGGLLLDSASGGSATPVMGMDSFGNVVPASPYSLSVGVYPPPLPGQQSPNGHIANPNILVILVDQLRNPTWLPAGGQAAIDTLLPNIAAIRNHSYVFTNYFTAATACTPARATLLTGLYTQETCIFTTSDSPTNPPLNPAFPTYGTAAQTAGYSTFWFGKWHLSNYDVDGGPPSNDPYDQNLSGYGFDSPSVPSISVQSPNGIGNEGTDGPSSVTAANMNDYAILTNFTNWLTGPPTPTQPWCTTVSFVNPHDISFFPYSYFQSILTQNAGCPTSPASVVGLCAPTQTPRASYAAPPILGQSGPPVIPPLPSLYSTLPPNQSINGQANVQWNGYEDVATLPYGYQGKPDLQRAQQSSLAASNGHVVHKSVDPTDWPTGWETFLNYYFWMQACVDQMIGQVLTALQGSTFWTNTVIIFAADHGGFAGSHAMRAKGGALYDEAINVPLYVSYPGQRTIWPTGNVSQSLSYMCSSVDFLPMIYTIATNSFSWRQSSTDPYYYLAGREAIMDAIWYGGTGHKRKVTITVNGTPTVYNYLLHTTDEFSANEVATTPELLYSTSTSLSHAVGIRTVLNSDGVTPGAKLGVYSEWGSCSTLPDSTAPQYEFYDYAGNWGTANPAETGNDGLTSSGALTTGAQAYSAALNSLLSNELYGNALFAAYSNLACAHDQALQIYLGTGCTVTFPMGCTPLPYPT